MKKKFTLLLCLTLFLFLITSAQEKKINSTPTLHPIEDLTVKANGDSRFIALSGITAGVETYQTTTISANTSNHHLIEAMNVEQTSNGQAYIQYRLQRGATGTATITVIVKDNGLPSAETTRSFVLRVESSHSDIEKQSSLPIATTPNSHSSLKAYPNPLITNALITFSTPSDEQRTSVDLYTITGTKIRSLFNAQTNANQIYYVPIKRDNIPGGIYLIRLTNSQQTRFLKLIIVN